MTGAGVGLALNHINSASTLTDPCPLRNGPPAPGVVVWALAAPAANPATNTATAIRRTLSLPCYIFVRSRMHRDLCCGG
jgi:hypothetical protein